MMYLFNRFVARLHGDDEGQTLVEYALILALVSIVAIGALALLGAKIDTVLRSVTTAL